MAAEALTEVLDDDNDDADEEALKEEEEEEEVDDRFEVTVTVAGWVDDADDVEGTFTSQEMAVSFLPLQWS